MNVNEWAERQLPGQSEDSPANDAIGNVRRQDAVDIWTNHRGGERDINIRKTVQVSAGAAPDVGETFI